mgnify:CR=1 FL=1
MDLRAAFSLIFFDFFAIFLCFGLVFLADVFLFEGFFIACIRTAMRRSISASIKLASCLANVCSIDLTSSSFGITEVGETTEYYVEIDPDYDELVEHLSIGKITDYTSKTYRDLGEEKSGESNGFRAWLDERIRTALRVADSAKSGHVNPTVSEDCKYCKVRRLCPSAKLGGNL